MSHYVLQSVVELPQRSQEITLREIRERAQQDMHSSDVVIEFSRDVITKLACLACHEEERRFAALGTVSYNEGRCPRCGQIRTVVTSHSYDGCEDFGDLPVSALGLPLYDVFTGRENEREIGYLISGDRAEVLGRLSVESDNEA
jgi:phage FluMu protein Com